MDDKTYEDGCTAGLIVGMVLTVFIELAILGAVYLAKGAV